MTNLEKLQKEISLKKVDFYVISTNDVNLLEYTPNQNKRLQWLTNFTGSNGIALIEIGYNQLERVSDLARLSNLHVHNVFKDLQGIPRCMILCHPNSTVL